LLAGGAGRAGPGRGGVFSPPHLAGPGIFFGQRSTSALPYKEQSNACKIMSQPSPAKDGFCRIFVQFTRFLDATARICHFVNYAFCAVATFYSTHGAPLHCPRYNIDVPSSVASRGRCFFRVKSHQILKTVFLKHSP